MSQREVRVRFAPSPTGPLHIGGVRTALFNYLFARKHGGKFILRIEDTDQTRFVPGAEDYIVEAFKWMGIEFDEGVHAGGEYGPYRQSDRKEMYKQYAEQLIASDWAYYAFDTPEELDAMRTKLEAEKATNTSYSHMVRMQMRNSLALTKEETEQLIADGAPYVVRFKMPENEEIVMNDLIRGEVKVNTAILDDKVLFKSDGMPTYHLANIVDDHLMNISHVIRGEEWLPSMALHVMLYRALGWAETQPEFAHLPLILKPTGKGKLSKRDGDKMGFPVFPLQWTDPKSGDLSAGYREDGYLPSAFLNYMALLGWNAGTDQEIFSLEELIAQFSIERIVKSGSRFDPEKAKWFNHQYIQQAANSDLLTAVETVVKAEGIEADSEKLLTVIGLVKERLNLLPDFMEQARFFFVAPTEYDAKTVKKRWKEDTPAQMQELHDLLAAQDDFGSEKLEEVVKAWIAEKEYNMGGIMNAFRLSIVGAPKGPHMFDIVAIVGKAESLNRLQTAIATIKK